MNAPLVLVIPAFNEAGRIDAAAFGAFLEDTPGANLLFVDDGSTDSTRGVLDAIVRSAPPGRADVLSLGRNAGKAEAVRAGMQHATASGADMVGFADADLSAPLGEVVRLRDELERFPETWAAIGSRVKLLGRSIERSETRHYLGRVFATFASMTLGLPVYDTQCGMKLFRNVEALDSALAHPFASRWIFDVELIDRLARTAGHDHRIREVPLEQWREQRGSRVRLADFARAPIELWRIRRGR